MIFQLAHAFGPPPGGGSWLDADDVTILTAIAVLDEINDRIED